MKKKSSRTNDRKPQPVRASELQQVRGRAGLELDIDGVRDPLEYVPTQHNETIVRESARSQRTAPQEPR